MAWISQGLLFLSRTGSHAYGCATPESDEDYKGIAAPPEEYYYSPFLKFEQATLKNPNPDCQIHSVLKYISLASKANPNMLELLFITPENNLYISPLGEKLIENRDEFLSRRIKYTFSGYAHSQISRLKLHRSWLLNPPVAPPTRAEMGLPERTLIPSDQLAAAEAAVRKEMEKFNFDFLDGLDEDIKIGLKEVMSEMLAELKITGEEFFIRSARSIGLSDNLIEIMLKEREYEAKKRHWKQYQTWLKERNPKRAILEKKYGFDCKFAYHIYRLGATCEQALRTGKLVVKQDPEVLMAIRNGEWKYEELLEWTAKNNKTCDELYENSVLPHSVNSKKINNLAISIVRESLKLYENSSTI